MEVHLTPEQAEVVEQAVASGRYATVEEAVGAALVLLDNHRKLAEVRALIDEATPITPPGATPGTTRTRANF